MNDNNFIFRFSTPFTIFRRKNKKKKKKKTRENT